MFGPALLIAPVTSYKQRARQVVLPAGAQWYDFWTGEAVAGSFSAPAPYDRIPVFVRAGSIVPTGPVMQYVGERPFDPITLTVYAGADGEFTLYEDQGTNFNYENGAFTEIPIRWNDTSGTLTIGARKGSFAGMLRSRSFHIVFVTHAHPAAFSFAPDPIKNVTYSGVQLQVKLEPTSGPRVSANSR